MKYTHRVVMYSSVTLEYIKSVNAYTSALRAEKACDRLNAEEAKDPVFGRVFYEVEVN